VVGGAHRAKWELARLTEEVGRWWGGGEQPARWRSDDEGRLSRAGKTSALTCRLVRGRDACGRRSSPETVAW
jgi:hypothetical protein